MDAHPTPEPSSPAPGKAEPIITAIPAARVYAVRDLADALALDAARRYSARAKGLPLGPVTAFGKLDRELGGSLEPGVHVLHADPGTGKTAFALQIAATCGVPALYVTAEMSPAELMRRLCARVTETYLGKYKDGALTETAVREHVRRAGDACPDLRIVDGTAGPATPALMLAHGEALRTATGLLIVIDPFHRWAQSTGAAASEYDLLSAALSAIGNLSARLECPVLVIAERNRMSRQGSKGAGMDASAGTRSFEYGATTVLALDPPSKEAGGDPSPDEKRVRLTLQKNRSGRADATVDLLFHGGFQRFRESPRC